MREVWLQAHLKQPLGSRDGSRTRQRGGSGLKSTTGGSRGGSSAMARAGGSYIKGGISDPIRYICFIVSMFPRTCARVTRRAGQFAPPRGVLCSGARDREEVLSRAIDRVVLQEGTRVFHSIDSLLIDSERGVHHTRKERNFFSVAVSSCNLQARQSAYKLDAPATRRLSRCSPGHLHSCAWMHSARRKAIQRTASARWMHAAAGSICDVRAAEQ